MTATIIPFPLTRTGSRIQSVITEMRARKDFGQVRKGDTVRVRKAEIHVIGEKYENGVRMLFLSAQGVKWWSPASEVEGARA